MNQNRILFIKKKNRLGQPIHTWVMYRPFWDIIYYNSMTNKSKRNKISIINKTVSFDIFSNLDLSALVVYWPKNLYIYIYIYMLWRWSGMRRSNQIRTKRKHEKKKAEELGILVILNIHNYSRLSVTEPMTISIAVIYKYTCFPFNILSPITKLHTKLI